MWFNSFKGHGKNTVHIVDIVGAAAAVVVYIKFGKNKYHKKLLFKSVGWLELRKKIYNLKTI